MVKHFICYSSFNRYTICHFGYKPCDPKGYGKKQCAFVHNGYFQIYERIYTEKKSYECNQCNKVFANSSSLQKHEKNHTRKKTCECNQCGKAYASHSSLLNHEKFILERKACQFSTCQVCWQ